MFDDFLIRAGLAGIGLAFATGPLGCFVLWRRMAYFGDATAHAAVLGVALSFGFSISIYAGTATVALGMALAVAQLSARGHSMDMVLGVLAHSALALGLIVASQISGLRVDLQAYLFGDILTVTRMDLVVIWVGSMVTAGLIAWRWQALLTATVNEELAQSAGLNPARERLFLTIALALTVAISIKIVGALLISAMLIIPAAAARNLARSPEGMALIAIAIGITATLAGLMASLYFDTPAGPSIIAGTTLAFVLGLPLANRMKSR